MTLNMNQPSGNQSRKKEKLLFAMLPYWDPMIPPNGIAHLKSFLQQHGYEVKTVDIIVEPYSQQVYREYSETLMSYVPESKRGNFLNIMHDVLQNQLMAHYQHNDEKKYRELVKILVYHSYYVEIDNIQANALIDILEGFYVWLKKYFLDLLEEEKPDVLGVTAYKCTIATSMYVLKLAKEAYPSIRTLMGGGTFNESHAPDSPNFDALLKTTENYMDKLMLGPGELLVLNYLQGNLPEDKRVYTKDDIGGEVLGFDKVPLPDYSDFDTQKYPYLPATASASCIYECSFCVAKKVAGPYRIKNSEQTVEEMVRLYEENKHQLFFMTDSLLNPVATDLANAFIKKGVSLYYDSYFRVDKEAADINNTLLWRRGGLWRVRLGTESGSQKVLDDMNKRITVEDIKATISALAYAGIKTTTYWVIGHPDESEEDFQQTLDLIEELKDDIFQAECNPMLYHYSRQYSADTWGKYRRLLYPEDASDMLIFQSYTLDYPPDREETYKRMHRFEAHCKSLGIPNPYSLNEHQKADERWKRLHKNAVPSMVDLISRKDYIDDTKNISQVAIAKNKRADDGDFDF